MTAVIQIEEAGGEALSQRTNLRGRLDVAVNDSGVTLSAT